jgi:hypothetical protein
VPLQRGRLVVAAGLDEEIVEAEAPRRAGSEPRFASRARLPACAHSAKVATSIAAMRDESRGEPTERRDSSE